MSLIHLCFDSWRHRFRNIRRRRREFSVLAATVFAFAATATATAVDTRQVKAEKELKKTVSELFDILAERKLLATPDARTKRALLQSVLDALGCGATLAPREIDDSTGQRKLSPISRDEVIGGVYCYIQLTTVTNATAQALAARLGDSAFGHYEGLILDLRCARAGDAAAARKVAAAIAGANLPAALLIASGTRGAAELLAAQLRGQRHIALLGRTTAGHPFGWQQKKLSTGDALLLPRAPPAEKRRTDGAVAPDVTVPKAVATAALLDPNREIAPDRDPCLRRALDLLRAMAAFDPEKTPDAEAH